MLSESSVQFSKARRDLLVKIEYMIGSQCYNGNIQNYGPGGEWEGEGRGFRYPVTFLRADGRKTKLRYFFEEVSDDEILTGYYAFGANELNIFRALDSVLSYLETHHGLVLEGNE